MTVDEVGRAALLDLARLLDNRLARAAVGRAGVAELRSAELAAGRPWPPVIDEQGSMAPRPRTVPPRPLVVRNGLRDVEPGCAGQRCVRVVGGRWRCRECGVLTPVPTPVVGPRVAGCDCGDGLICAHPVAWAAS